jgi:hypothetical protein
MGMRSGLEDCRRVGGFEPEIGARVNSPENAVGMIAAGRGVLLGAEIGFVAGQGLQRLIFTAWRIVRLISKYSQFGRSN